MDSLKNDKLVIKDHEFNSRFIFGSGKYSMKLIDAAVKETRANGNDAAEITRLARMKAAACEEIAEEQVALAAAQAELQA